MQAGREKGERVDRQTYRRLAVLHDEDITVPVERVGQTDRQTCRQADRKVKGWIDRHIGTWQSCMTRTSGSLYSGLDSKQLLWYTWVQSHTDST